MASKRVNKEEQMPDVMEAVTFMPNRCNESKQRWNAAHYTQVKVSTDRDIAAAFKNACVAAGVSMAGVLSGFMAEYSQTAIKDKKPVNAFGTRKHRRRFVKDITAQMEQLADAEECYRDNIPVNLQGSIRYEAAEQSIAAIKEALEILEQIY